MPTGKRALSPLVVSCFAVIIKLMNNLLLTTKPTPDPDAFKVFWYLGKNANGVLEVDLTRSVDDKPVIAEMFALRYLLEEKQVCGANRTGEGLQITVSSGAIKKAQHADTGKTHLVRYAHFLATRFRDAEIEVEKDDAWVSGILDPEEHVILNANQAIDETIPLHGMGDVVLSRHALERYMERNKVNGFAKAYKSLKRIAAAGIVRPVSYSQNWELRQYFKHGVKARVFNHADSLINFVVSLEEGGRNVLSTVVFEDITMREKMPTYRGAFRQPA